MMCSRMLIVSEHPALHFGIKDVKASAIDLSGITAGIFAFFP